MLNRKLIVIAALIALLALSACGGESSDTASAEVGDSAANRPALNEVQTDRNDQQDEPVRLSTDYENALSEQSQLALGILQLDDTDLALDEANASEILPLWQALQSLSSSETTADAELKSVVNQIQNTLSSEQIQAIAGMQLTEESLTEMFESGGLGFGGFGRGGNQGAADGEGGFGGFAGRPGGGPGGLPGGGPGRGQAGFGNVSEDDIATRQAQFTEGGFGEFQDQALIRAVVVLLQTKTGEAPDRQAGAIFDTVFAVVSDESGLDIEDIRSQLAEGKTLLEIVEYNGGDLDSVRSSLTDALYELPNANDLNVEELVSDWLSRE